jgi:hypothetical protein
MTLILESSDRKFKVTIINMLRAIQKKCRQHVRTDGKCKQRDGKSKKESMLNATHQKHCNSNDEYL